VLTDVQAAVSYAERCAAEREAVAAADRALAALQRQQAMLEAEVMIRPVCCGAWCLMREWTQVAHVQERVRAAVASSQRRPDVR
jgi:hypothetical protein